MSHEIRTPLNGVLGMAELLLDGQLNSTQRHRAETLRASGTSLLRIVNDVLDFSRAEAGQVELEMIDFDLWDVVERVIAVTSSQAQLKGLSLDLEIDPAVPHWVRGDASRLRQVLLNLLSNAVKFTDRGRVEMHVTVGGPGELCFAAIDTGIGIEAQAQADIFEPYRQAEASTTRRFGGTGLGLSICRQLVELMQGKIEVDSEVGKGSTFLIHLPLPAIVGGGGGDRPEARPSKTDFVAASGSRALVVDDAPVNQLVATAMLGHLGFHTDVASNGAEAVAAVERGKYDVILMDCLMPVMDGYTAARKIRSMSGSNAQTPIVALTGSTMIGDRERCLSSGMDEYLPKPLDRAKLADLLGSLTRSASGETAARSTEPARTSQSVAKSMRSLSLELGGDGLTRVCALFQEHFPRDLAQLDAMVAAGEPTGARAVAHRLKGTALTVQAGDLASIAQQLEHDLEGAGEQALELIEQLHRELQSVMIVMDQTLARTAPAPHLA